MNYDLLSHYRRDLRGVDRNTLLRLHDLAREILTRSPLKNERAKADKAINAIDRELQKRDTPL